MVTALAAADDPAQSKVTFFMPAYSSCVVRQDVRIFGQCKKQELHQRFLVTSLSVLRFAARRLDVHVDSHAIRLPAAPIQRCGSALNKSSLSARGLRSVQTAFMQLAAFEWRTPRKFRMAKATGGPPCQEVIAHDESRWIGRIIDALFRVEASQ